MRLTMPQIIMLNHAAWVNSERMKSRIHSKKNEDDDDQIVYKGKRLSELNSEEMAAYYGDWS